MPGLECAACPAPCSAARRAAYASFPAVEAFITLPATGHCPMDERPDLVRL